MIEPFTRLHRIPILGLALLLVVGCGETREPLDTYQTALEPAADQESLIREAQPETMPELPGEGEGLYVSAVYNDQELELRLRYPTHHPIWYHQYLVYRDGEWVRYGSGSDGPDEYGLYEDRISVMWDDGSVEGFAQMGGFVTTHQGMRSTRSAVDASAVRAHPHLGERLGRSDVRKFIAESRADDVTPDDLWREVRSQEELQALREDGVFLDLWQWRAHRSHPVGFADNGYVLDYRHSSAGRSMYTDNVNAETGAPQYMYDVDQVGLHALRFDQLVARAYGQDDPYYLSETLAVPFNPDYPWEEGDAIPHRLLRQPDGSRGAIRAQGGYEDDAWQIALTRSMAAPDRLDSKEFVDGEQYYVAFAVHTGGAGAKHHLVSMPVTFGFGVEADIIAERVDGALTDAEAEWHRLHLFNPGDPTQL